MLNSTHNTVVIGAGPRGLSAAIALISKGSKVTIIDPAPLSSWSPDQVLDIVMRSPVTFDLVTGIEELQDYSLAKYLGLNIPFSKDQRTIEASDIPVTRKDFYCYITDVMNRLLSQGLELIQEEVVSISNSSVTTTSSSIAYSSLIIANGYKGGKKKEPTWIHNSSISSRLKSQEEIIANPPKGKKVTVVGSGQGAAEFAYELALTNQVTWIQNRKYRVYKYPGPAWDLISYKSVLGPYFKNFCLDGPQRAVYSRLVRSYTPTITPHIASLLKTVTLTELIPSTINEFLFEDAEVIVSICGFDPDIRALPWDNSVPVTTLPHKAEFPMLTNFKMPNTSIYFTGILAIMYDGPRQNSLISSGPTSKSIAEDIWLDQ